ncbi:MAG: hypothetical protein L0211_02220 [Planctomycetaceae bacterium]|nr:hypothetical protein [Planctomycetaceae bacterium]
MRLALLTLALVAVPPLIAQEEKDVPWDAVAEIARRGDLVEHVDGVHGDAPIADVMQTPADDSGKWHFTLVTTKGCKACQQVLADFLDSPVLAAWVNVSEYKRSWAHWQVVDVADPTQAWRWKDFKPTAFPTLIVQPPFDASWGDPHTVVFLQTGRSDPKQLDSQLRKAIGLYATKMHPQHQAWHLKQGLAPRLAAGGFEQVSGPPPFDVPAPLPVPMQQPVYQTIPPQQPEASALGGGIWIQLLVLLMGSNVALKFLLPMFQKWQEGAKKTPSPLDDLVFGFVRKALEDRLKIQTPPGP